jgi:hypothetical protein
MRTSAAVSGALSLYLLLAGGAAQASTVPNFGGPGVSPPGYPAFWGTNVDATVTRNKNGTFTLSVIGSAASCGGNHTSGGCSGAAFNVPGASYVVGSETLNLTANFSSSGMFSSGSYTITGSLPASSNPSFGTAPGGLSWGAQGNEILLTANLTADTIDSSNEALGFTEVITGGWADQAQFTSGSPESVWLYSLLGGLTREHGLGKGNSSWDKFLAELNNGRGLHPATLSAIGSIATVPLPDTVALLGSGLLGLLWLVRRRRPAPVAC